MHKEQREAAIAAKVQAGLSRADAEAVVDRQIESDRHAADEKLNAARQAVEILKRRAKRLNDDLKRAEDCLIKLEAKAKAEAEAAPKKSELTPGNTPKTSKPQGKGTAKKVAKKAAKKATK